MSRSPATRAFSRKRLSLNFSALASVSVNVVNSPRASGCWQGQVRSAVQGDDGLAGAGRSGNASRAVVVARHPLLLFRVEKNRPLFPRIRQRLLQGFQIGHHAEAALSVRVVCAALSATYTGTTTSLTVSRISISCAAPVLGWVSSFRRSAQSYALSW